MFFITTIDSKFDDMRCVGYFTSLEKAKQAVLNNAADINETCYNYAVIEEIPEGLYRYDDKPIWFKWNDELEEYEEINESPDKYRNQAGFGIG